MKDRKSSPRRRAIVILFLGGFQPPEIARVLKLKTRDVLLVLRQALG